MGKENLRQDREPGNFALEGDGKRGVTVLKILTLNINGYQDKHGDWMERRSLICDSIRALAPDVIALQAVRSDPGFFAGASQAAQIQKLLEGYPNLRVEWGGAVKEGVQEGSALLSKGTILHTDVLRMPPSKQSPDQTVRLVLRARLRIGARELTLYNAHLSWVDAAHRRNIQIAAPFFESVHGPSVVLGDFNAAPDSPGIRELLQRGWQDAWMALKPHEFGYTFEADRPAKRIDYVFVNTPLKASLKEIDVVGQASEKPPRLSDHLGIFVAM